MFCFPFWAFPGEVPGAIWISPQRSQLGSSLCRGRVSVLSTLIGHGKEHSCLLMALRLSYVTNIWPCLSLCPSCMPSEPNNHWTKLTPKTTDHQMVLIHTMVVCNIMLASSIYFHILIQWLKQTIPPLRLVKLNDFQFVGTNFAENWIHNKLAEQYNLLEGFLQLWLNVL